MQQQTTLIIILLTCSISSAIAANILAIQPVASPSHHIWNSVLTIALAERGHNLTVISPMGLKKPVANITDIVIEGLIEETQEEFDFEEMADMSNLILMREFFALGPDVCSKIIKSPGWAQIMNYPSDTKFDLILTEATAAECLLLGAMPRFGNPPIVTIIAFSVPPWIYEGTGTPQMISYMPHFMYSASDHMTFCERVTNLIYYALSFYNYHYYYVPRMEQIAKEYYGSNIPSLEEITERMTVQMANVHPVFDFPFATTPNLIPVAGLQIKDPRPLPQDLQKFLDDAKEGVILFSLGTNVKSKDLKEEKRKEIMNAFAELPQKVLWKFEDENMPGRPANVKIAKWLPQTDILAHPNVKVFITHAGLLSTHEAIYRGVPVIGIPFFGDQPINIDRMVHFGVGIRLNYKDVNKENLLRALQTILQDDSYRENMKAVSARFRDNPETPLERAVFWTEYVLRHNGAPHLRSAAKDLNFIQYFLLDVIVFLLAIPSIVIFVLYRVCCKKKSKKGGKQKQN